MPIRAENRDRYPKDWPEISNRIRFERAEGWCEFCRIAEHGKPHPVTGSIVILTTAHLDHTPEHCDDDNLAAMCQRCHLTYDAAIHRRNREQTNREKLNNLELFEGGRDEQRTTP